MKKAIAVMLLGLLFTSTVAAQKRKSDREHDGLIGPVKSVVVETSQLSSKAGKSIEGKRVRRQEIFFGVDGNVTKMLSRDQINGFLNTHVYTYDNKGNRRESLFFAGGYPPNINSGKSDDPAVYFTYGRTERNPDGSFTIIWNIKYDGLGNRIEEDVRWGFSSSMGFRNIYGYDSNGHRKEMHRYSRGGWLIRKYVYTYDRDKLIEQAEYKRNGALVSRESYTYEFDSTGNWIKRITSKWISNNGNPYFEPVEATYRTITYYQ